MSGSQQRSWDPHKMYDLSPAEIKSVQQRAARKSALKDEWQRKVTDPFREGVVFDPAIQRYNALKATQFEYFKVTPKSSMIGFLLTVVPVGVLYYIVQSRHDEFERKCRAGEIPARDRTNKFMY